MSGSTRRRSARVAKQPTAPVDRIPEVKEMSLEQQLEFGMVWRGTEGNLWRFILFTDECCGALLEDDDGNAWPCLARARGPKVNVRDVNDGAEVPASHCGRHRGYDDSVVEPYVYMQRSSDEGTSWQLAGAASPAKLDALELRTAGDQYQMVRPHEYRQRAKGWPTEEEWGKGLADWRSEWEELEEDGIARSRLAYTTPSALREQKALRDRGDGLRAQLQLVASGQLGADTPEAQAALAEVEQTVKEVSAELHRNITGPASRVKRKKTARDQAATALEIVDSAVRFADEVVGAAEDSTTAAATQIAAAAASSSSILTQCRRT